MADRPSFVRRWSRHAVAAVLVLAALSAASWMNTVQGGNDAFHRLANAKQYAPFVIDGVLGRPVTARTFTVTVESVAGSRKITADTGVVRQQAAATGIFVVLTAVVQAGSQPTPMQRFVLRDNTGREFSATRRWDQPVVGWIFQPRMPTRVQPVFEVPADATGLQLLVSARADERLDSEVRVPLGVTDQLIGGWSTAKSLTVKEPVTLPTGPRAGR